IALGVDMFDCVLPTRNARHGLLFTRQGIRSMRNEKYAADFSPLDPESDYWLDQYYTKAYLRHLFPAEELLALQLATLHNLRIHPRSLEFARRGSEDLQLFRDFEARFTRGLGVVDVKTHDVETPAVVAERIREALAFLPVDRLSVNPDCGLLHLPREVAFAKL